jgi:CRISPR-associated endonuclease Cas3-HD
LLGEPTTFWGKLRRVQDGTTTDWHPLADHCADVSSVVEALLQLPVWRKRLQRFAGMTISEVGWARLCVLAALHDLGKLNVGFQAKGRTGLGATAGRVTEALGALRHPVFSCLSELLPWGDGVAGLLAAAICHHGRPYTQETGDNAWQESWWQPCGGLDPRGGAEELFMRCRTWFPRAFDADGSALPETPAYTGRLEAMRPVLSMGCTLRSRHRGDPVQVVGVTDSGASRGIAVATRPWLEHHDALATEAFAAAALGAKVLVIKNTVKDCVATHVAIERLADTNRRRDVLFNCSGVAAPHHARFARPDREVLDRALETHFGKERAAGGCVVVATQTVQQSLDLDADILFSDLCPADVLLQRLGRLHRHARPRPAGFEQPRAFVVAPERRDLGVLISDSGIARHHHGLGGSVYPDLRILEATWRLIEKHREWRIPVMNRHLVENSLHSEVLSAVVGEGGERWQAHANQKMGSVLGQRRQADLNLVDWSTPYGQTAIPSGVDQRIMTRLGEGDRRVRFQTPLMSPFGQTVGELVLRAWWVPLPGRRSDTLQFRGPTGT